MKAFNLFKNKNKIDEIKNTNLNYSIDEISYTNNLEFYTVLKQLLKCQLSERQLIDFQGQLLHSTSDGNGDMLRTILLESGVIVNTGTKKYDDFLELINLLTIDNFCAWLDMVDTAIELMLVKDLILQESKMYVNNQYKKIVNDVEDKLSVTYDTANLTLPYGQRVISSMLVYVITSDFRDNEYILEASNKSVNAFNNKIINLIDKYNINCNNMFDLVMGESTNQSIKSTAGQSYETRVKQMLIPIVDDLKGQTHDSKISSVEYDNIITLNNSTIGVSAKRTLRERYKQNFEDVELLDVDKMFLITLGVDLNEEKLNNILQKNGLYVIVADEIYQSKIYLKSNNRVISSKDLTREKLESILL
ncbi:MAG: hypothetical protein R3Y21_05250 [Mycoplasmatota bacterium]